MTRLLAPLLCGVLFALGLGLAGMTDPNRVLAFLEFRDPALMFVMGGAVAVTLVGFPAVLRRERPLLAPRFELPAQHAVDRGLLVGAAVFGLGWGLVGLCPGPALTGLVTGEPLLLLFVVTMLVGLRIAR